MGTASGWALDPPSLSIPRLTWNPSQALLPVPETTRQSSTPRCLSSQTVETRPGGSAQPGIPFSSCCFQKGFSPTESFRKFHSGFRGSMQTPTLLAGALERFAVTTGLCQRNKSQLVSTSMQNRPAPITNSKADTVPKSPGPPPTHHTQTGGSPWFPPTTKQLQRPD